MNAETRVPFDWAAATQAAGNDSFSGDQYLVQPAGDRVLLAVVDGLGHGEKAAEVAEMAIAVLRDHAHEPPEALFQRCHRRLIGSRGVVMSLASVDVADGRLTWLGVGNVEGILLRADVSQRREAILLRGGIVGYRLPALHPTTLSLARGDVLLLATDGLRSAFARDIEPGRSAAEMADDLLARYLRGNDDALILVARYLGAEPGAP
ncbi:MAG: SpoIIE family protein phosphatase [Anaerolineae bacterium]|jgi:serine phosphatase RsbU (regulator of sigma subunit)|nr:SpoIIE family protein phosphatase [Anaerolineae bacterium]MDX9828858.1 SpoIIE family protein phosphatase [Anaerolineae bacterium]